MKKIFAISVVAALAVASCKKHENTVSELRNYSTPTITLKDGHFYSIPVGGLLPTIQATAYDSFYNEDATVVFDKSKLDVTIPGIYSVYASAKNKYGMGNTDTLYIAVTDIADVDISGRYVQVATADTMTLTRLANGFYHTSDAAGVGLSDTTNVLPAMFVQTSATSLVMPVQYSKKFGSFTATNGVVNLSSTDTTYSYELQNANFSAATRTFRRVN
jgi:hypothetical protein